MTYDLAAAKAAGVSDNDIAAALAIKHNYDLSGALSSGVPVADIVDALVSRENSTAPTQEAAKDRFSAWEKFSYGWDSTDSDISNWSDYLESRFPLGTIGIKDGLPTYISPNERYGDDFTNLTPDQRRERIKQSREQAVYNEHKALIDSGYLEQKENEAWYDIDASTGGSFLGTLATPTTLLAAPLKWGARGLAVTSGLLTGETIIAQQLAKEGEITPVDVASGTALGAGGGLLLGKLSQYISKKIGQQTAAKAAQQDVDDAIATVTRIENALVDEVAAGTAPGDIPTSVATRLNLAPEDIAAAISKSGKRVFVPSTQEALAALEARAMTTSTQKPGALTGDYLTVLSTAVREISEPILGRLRKLDFATHTRKADLVEQVSPFLKGFNELPAKARRSVSLALYNGEFDSAANIIKTVNPSLVPRLDKVKNILEGFHTELKDAGYSDLGFIENYFPRQVKDYASLTNKLGAPRQTLLLTNLKSAGDRLGVKARTIQGYISALPESEVIDVFNKTLRGVIPNKAGPGFVKVRSIAQVTDDILDEYASVPEALVNYINRAVDDIETRYFFGREAVEKGVRNLDLDESIGAYVAREMKQGLVNPDDADRLAQLLKARFVSGQKQAGKMVQAFRNIGYMTTLANPVSALTQLQDLAMPAVINGFKHTLGAMLGRRAVSVADLGLDNAIAAELNSPTLLAKLLDKTLQVSGFKLSDRLGKNTFINSSYRRFASMANTKAGEASIRNKYGNVFGAETDALINDLKAKKVSDNVKLLLWNELADVQPIALSEMPIKYLEMPNGRLLYSLKTFAIRQLDSMRRNVIDEYKKGNKRQAVKFLASYLTIVPLMGASVDQLKNALLGREAALENIPDEYVGNIFKLFGVSSYLAERYLGQGNVSQFIINTVAPPLGWLDAALADIGKLVESGDVVPEKVIQQLPVGGKIWYQWFGGGIEKDLERKQREEQ